MKKSINEVDELKALNETSKSQLA